MTDREIAARIQTGRPVRVNTIPGFWEFRKRHMDVLKVGYNIFKDGDQYFICKRKKPRLTPQPTSLPPLAEAPSQEYFVHHEQIQKKQISARQSLPGYVPARRHDSEELGEEI